VRVRSSALSSVRTQNNISLAKTLNPQNLSTHSLRAQCVNPNRDSNQNGEEEEEHDVDFADFCDYCVC